MGNINSAKDAFDTIEAKGFTISGLDYVRNF